MGSIVIRGLCEEACANCIYSGDKERCKFGDEKAIVRFSKYLNHT